MENSVSLELWQKCMDLLQDEVQLQQFNTWLRPLKVVVDSNLLCLLAPNRFVLDWVKDKFLLRIEEVLDELSEGNPPTIALGVTMGKTSFSGRYSRKQHSLPKEVSMNNAGLRGEHNKKKVLLKNDPRHPDIVDSTLLPRKRHARKSQHSGSGLHDSNRSQKNLDLGPSCAENDLPDTGEKGQENLGLDGLLLEGSGTQGTLGAHSLEETVFDFSATPKEERGASSFCKKQRQGPLEKTTIDKLKEKHRQKGSAFPVQQKAGERETKNKKQTHDKTRRQQNIGGGIRHISSLNRNFTFDTFVEGKSNQLALAAARQVGENSGSSYNPLFIYGGVGLGKTHLMQAVGNSLFEADNKANVVYLHSERFVADMVKALQLNAINDFKRYYRSVDALLIDDIQFFSGKERSQEEFFHTFNALLEGGQQVILTCDRYPKEIGGLEERLKSRFGWGLTVAVEPPELETRVAILIKKAEQANVMLPSDAAFFIAQRIRSNVRELEGTLKRVIACAHFMGTPINIDLIREALKDLFALQDKLVSVENIQKTVAAYFKIKVSDLLSKTRVRTVARPRQISMALAKKLTNHSLPEIGEAHGGRDHTTVLHACRKIEALISVDNDVADDYQQLLKSLTN